MRRHSDGTICLEGTRSVPHDYVACCETFLGHTTTCEYDIRYEWWHESRQWVIAIAEAAGGGGIIIEFCPHCGTKLPSTRVLH